MVQDQKLPPHPWSVPLAVDTIPDDGGHYEIAADAAAREAVAKVAGLRSLPKLEASFDVFKRGAGVEVVGRVSATVGQTCVVSLEPIENEISEEVDLVYSPEADDTASRDGKKDSDPPEPLHNGVMDLGAAATEFLMLGIDPYPRKPGVEFSGGAPDSGTTEKADNPFAVLQALKERSGRT